MLLAALAGCPFIFGPPNLSRVDRGGPDATRPGRGGDDDDDGAVHPGDDDDASDPIDHPPTLDGVTVEPYVDGFLIQGVLTDPDGDLDGGQIEVRGVGPTLQFRVPEDVLLTDDLVRLVVPSDDACESWSRTVHVMATDAAGHAGDVIDIATQGDGTGVVSGYQYPYTTLLGPIRRDFVTCATLKGQQLDGYTFWVEDPGPMTLRVSWQSGAANIDFDLWDRETHTLVASGWSDYVPESIAYDFHTERFYDLFVYFYEGSDDELYAITLIPE